MRCKILSLLACVVILNSTGCEEASPPAAAPADPIQLQERLSSSQALFEQLADTKWSGPNDTELHFKADGTMTGGDTPSRWMPIDGNTVIRHFDSGFIAILVFEEDMASYTYHGVGGPTEKNIKVIGRKVPQEN